MTPAAIIYWDSSAVLSALLTEIHSQDARQKLEIADATHIVSSLVWAEVFAVLARMERDGHRPATPAAARLALARGPWEYTPAAPDREHLRSLAQRWALPAPIYGI